MTDEERIAQLTEEYKQLAHAMQSGVATEMHLPYTKQTDPKHLRVGVNSAMVDAGALAGLLIRKGIITELEYVQAIRDGMAAEVEAYQQRLTEYYGRPITLG
jgi:hypothetical protein